MSRKSGKKPRSQVCGTPVMPRLTAEDDGVSLVVRGPCAIVTTNGSATTYRKLRHAAERHGCSVHPIPSSGYAERDGTFDKRTGERMRDETDGRGVYLVVGESVGEGDEPATPFEQFCEAGYWFIQSLEFPLNAPVPGRSVGSGTIGPNAERSIRESKRHWTEREARAERERRAKLPAVQSESMDLSERTAHRAAMPPGRVVASTMRD